MGSYNPELQKQLADALGELLRPGQVIGFDKLLAKAADTNKDLFSSKDRVYAGVRELMARGFLTRQLRRTKPALLTFHNPPLPTPQPAITRKRRSENSDGTTSAGDSIRIQRFLTQLKRQEDIRAEADHKIAEIKKKLAELLTG